MLSINKKIHFIGIAGKTMSQLAKTFKDLGWAVSGSDQEKVYPPVSDYLEKNKINFFRGYAPENIPKKVSLIVVGRSALLIDRHNPEYLEAKKFGCRVMSYPEILQRYLIKTNSIVVAGTYGKTTSTGLLAWILIKAGFNPSYAIGGEPVGMADGVKISDSDYSVVEGDETPALQETDPPKFLYYQPKYLLLTATKWDHPEVYKTHGDYLASFAKLVSLLPVDGLLVYNQDSVEAEVVKKAKCKKISYSLNNPKADYTKNSLNFQTVLLGKANLENICGVIAMADQLGIDKKIITAAIGSFKGIKTRLEFLGEYSGKFVYWDLAQHAEKVKGSLKALREHYLKNRLICVYDPAATELKHRESLGWLKGAFDSADVVFVGRVSFLKRIGKEERVTGHDLVEIISKTQSNVYYEPDDEKLTEKLVKETKPKDVIVFMSSGGLRFTDMIKNTINELTNYEY